MGELEPFREAIEELETLARQPVLPAREVGLGRARRLLAEIGNPHRSFRAVHVTGSSGKGSTTTMLGSILESAGMRTGYLRSPHLASYTERIAVNNQPIPERAWAAQWARVRPTVEAMASNRLPDYDLGRPTFSEVIFALAALHFRESGAQWAALEAGLGGRYDATNIVESDAAVITTVSLEHTQVLGDTVGAIAAEKAAIIKPGSSAVTGAEDAEALRVIAERAREVNAPLVRVPADITFDLGRQDLAGTEVTIDLGDGQVDVRLALLGEFQARNAAVAAASALALRRRGMPLNREQMIEGLQRARLPGRLEVVDQNPLVILDGAHHPAAMTALRMSLQRLLPDGPVVVLFTALRDKNIAAMADEVKRMASSVILTTAPGTPRSVPTEELARYFDDEETRVLRVEEPERALRTALGLREGALVVCGSLYLVGFVREALLRSRVTP